MKPDTRDAYQTFLWGQILLFGLLSTSLVLFASPAFPSTYELPEMRLVLRTAILLAGVFVAVLAGARFTVEGHRLDLLLAGGFFLTAVNVLAFSVIPVVDSDPVASREEWADIAGSTMSLLLVAAAPFATGRVHRSRGPLIRVTLATCVIALIAAWATIGSLDGFVPELAPGVHVDPPVLLTLSFAVQSLLSLVALIGFGIRYRSGGEDLHRWLAVGSTMLLFASLHRLFTPLIPSNEVSHADFLRVLGYVVLLVGVWRAIRSAEFGRAVAEERARIAREIHDGLAQYLFAVSAQASMLENGADPAKVVPQLRDSAAAAQREARFAILALSSASGEAPFDAALRRYVELLTADGELEVDLEIDPGTKLGADEQIELFRIVQEGLANVRRHAGAKRAEVRIGRRGGQRYVSVCDDGGGFDDEASDTGQGLKNMRARAVRIGGVLTLQSQPGSGTALEVVLR